MMRKTARRDRILELHRQGWSNPQIAEKLGCNRVTAWRITKDLPKDLPVVLDAPPTSAPVSPAGETGQPNGKLLEFNDLRLSVGVLRERAAAGSTAAARDVAKLSLARINRQSCRDHVDRATAEADMLGIFQVCKHFVIGSFMRRVLMEFPDVDEERLAAMVEDTFDDIARDLEARQTVEEEQK